MSRADDLALWSHTLRLRGTADRALRARTDAWLRLMRHRAVHARRPFDMSASPNHPAGVSIRRSTAADWGRVASFLARYQEASRHSVLSPDDPTPAVEIPSGTSRAGMLLAEWEEAAGDEPTIVGLVSWWALSPEPACATIALVTARGWAARGVGPALVAAAAREARRRGIEAFLIPVIPRNGGLRAAARDAGFTERRLTTGKRDDIEIPLREKRA